MKLLSCRTIARTFYIAQEFSTRRHAGFQKAFANCAHKHRSRERAEDCAANQVPSIPGRWWRVSTFSAIKYVCYR